jgi:hypothetical protein
LAITENNPPPVLITNDDVADLIHGSELVQHPDQVIGIQIVEASRGLVLILLAEHLGDPGNRDAELRQLLLSYFDLICSSRPPMILSAATCRSTPALSGGPCPRVSQLAD